MVFLLQARRKRRGLFGRHAETVHAGVNVDRRSAAPALSGDEGVPLGELHGAVDDRLHVEFGERIRSLGRKAVEHVNRGFTRPAAGAARFGNVGNEEGLAAGFNQPRRDRLEAKAIRVGFDDRAALDGKKPARQRLPIVRNRIEIDGQRAAGLRIVWGARHFGQWFSKCHAGLWPSWRRR